MLVQEGLAQIGIKVALNKIPGANWRAEQAKKALPMVVNLFGGWLLTPEYFFFWNYHGQNSQFPVDLHAGAGATARPASRETTVFAWRGSYRSGLRWGRQRGF